jgi:GH25 family lysozyme M1 (1,4-beta-N-acetylmuramidase)
MPTGRDLSPPGFVPKAPTAGSYVQRHPTHYWYRSDIADLVERTYAKFGRDRIHINTYHDHPATEFVSHPKYGGRDSTSFDVWGPGGRGDPLPRAIGQHVFNYLFEDKDPPDIEWCIYQGRMWVRGEGIQDSPNGRPIDSDPAHVNHAHFTYLGPDVPRQVIPKPQPKPKPKPAPKPPPKPRKYGKEDPIWGVDVASHQQGFSLTRAKTEGYDFAWVKATEGPYLDGTTYVNPLYRKQMGEARAAGMTVGSYVFLVETKVEPQLDLFMRTIGGVEAVEGQMIAIDFEAYPGYPYLTPTNATLKAFVKGLRKRIGNHPIILYSGKGFWNGGDPSGPVTAYDPDLVTWDANYPLDFERGTGSELYFDALEYGWGARWGGREPMFWQFSSTGLVAGHALDVNAFRGTPAELKALTKAALAPKPPVEIPPKPPEAPADEIKAIWKTLVDHDKALLGLDERIKTLESKKCKCSENLSFGARPAPFPSTEKEKPMSSPIDVVSPEPRKPGEEKGDLPYKAIIAAVLLLANTIMEVYETGSLAPDALQAIIANIVVPIAVYFMSNRRQ